MITVVGQLAVWVTASAFFTKEVQDGGEVISFATWVVVLAVLVGVLAVPLGWLIARRNRVAGYLILVASPIAAVVFAPMLASDRVAYDADHFEAHYGLWWSPSEFNIRFADLREIRIVSKESWNRGRKSTSYFLDCVMKTGETQQVSVGTLMQEVVDEILARARKRGVPVINPEQP
jgi:hypothetical protein